MTIQTPPGLRLVGNTFRPRLFIAIVQDDTTNQEIRVRVDYRKRSSRFRCDACGPSPTPDCPHALIAYQLTNPRRTA